jgi:hypothetical protein
MRLQFLGSGDAFGSGGRFNTCFHLERPADGNVLIDCGASSMVAIRKWQGGFKRSSQHRLCSSTGATRQAPLRAFSNPVFFAAWR